MAIVLPPTSPPVARVPLRSVPEGPRAGLASGTVVGTRVDATSYQDAADRVVRWAREGRSAVVCVATVNNLMEANDDPSFRGVMHRADLVTPDGMPLVWALKLLGVAHGSRVAGPDLTPHVLSSAAAQRIPVGFLGGTPQVLRDLLSWAQARFPSLIVSFSQAPPFRPLSSEEEQNLVRVLVESGTKVLFVGLGCPKQEFLMDRLRGRVPAVMVGVGAAFDFLSGHKRRAPAFLQRMGLEWAFRLALEPRRLWRRYLRHNPRFIALLAHQAMRERRVRKTGV